MLTNPGIGTSVTLDAGSKWFGLGINPSSTALQGVITSIEGHWIEVLWSGSSSALNYRAYDLNEVV